MKLLSSLTACFLMLGAVPAAPVETVNPDAFARRIEAALPGWMDRYNVPGVGIALIEHGEVVYQKTFGYADQAAGTPLTPDTLFQVASTSKGVTAWGVLKLVDEGRIRLDDPVEKYLTRWHIPPSEFDVNGVTIRRLLNHTAGISLEGYGQGVPVGDPLPTIVESLSGETRGCGAVRLARAPGGAMMYSGGGYSILQLMVEEVTGRPFADYMKESVLDPLGMTGSVFDWNPGMQIRLSRAYGSYLNVIPNQTYVEDAAGGLYSSLDDMARYGQALARGSDLLSGDSYAQLFAGEGYGLGYGLIDYPGGRRFVFGGGTRMGWQSDFVVDQVEGSGIVILANANGGVILDLELINEWAQWKSDVAWPGAELFLWQYPIALGIALFLGLICLVYGLVLAAQFRRGRRVFMLPGSSYWPLRLIWVALLAAAMVLWWLFGFTDTFDPQARMLWAPEPFLHGSILGALLASELAVGALFPMRKTPA